MSRMDAEWHRVGLERPHFLPLTRGQKTPGIAPAQQETSFAARGEKLREAGKAGGITYFGVVLSIFCRL
jgi:hypothetical protein